MFIIPIQPMQPMVFSEPGQTLKPEPRTATFQSALTQAVTALERTQRVAREDSFRVAYGNVDNIGEIMINSMKAESMLQTTVQVTSRVLSAYRDIMSIQV